MPKKMNLLYFCRLKIQMIMKKIHLFFLFAMVLGLSTLSAQVMKTVDFQAPVQERSSSWLTWASNTDIYHMIGFDGTTEYYALQRFAASDLTSYNGQQLTKVRFLPSSVAEEPTSAAYSVVVYTGGSYTGSTSSNTPGTLACIQTVTDITYGQWKTITLNTPVTINASQELWIGVKVTAYAGYAMSHDDATPVSGKGNLMGYNGSWGLPDDFFNNADVHNWNIAGLVGDGNEEDYIDLSVFFINNGTDQDEITSMTVPAGQPFKPVLVIRNERSIQASADYTDTIFIKGYMDNTLISTHTLARDTLESGRGVWLTISELSTSDIFNAGYCGTTRTFCYEVQPTAGWNDADPTNNRGCLSVTFGAYETVYHITVLNEDSTITPCCEVDAYPGATQRFVITPPEGKRIAQAIADGADVTANIHTLLNVGKTYTFNNIQSDHTFQVLYEDIPETSVNDNEYPEITLFPNPANDRLNVTAESAIQEVRIFDCTGQLIRSYAPASNSISLEIGDLQAGIYFINLYIENQIVTKRFVKM